MESFFQQHYNDWRTSRLNGIKKYLIHDYLLNKTLFEIGSGKGEIGNSFSKMGAIVTCSDARQEYVDFINQTYTNLKAITFDANHNIIGDKFDIILHWGVLYHIAEIETHLKNVSECCNVLFLETEVCNSNDGDTILYTNEEGYDQAFNNIGCRPSPTYVEKLLIKYEFKYQMIVDDILNSGFHIYDWNVTNTNDWKHGLRRYWICWKNVSSPINNLS